MLRVKSLEQQNREALRKKLARARATFEVRRAHPAASFRTRLPHHCRASMTVGDVTTRRCGSLPARHARPPCKRVLRPSSATAP